MPGNNLTDRPENALVSRGPPDEVTYGPFGERYEVEYLPPPRSLPMDLARLFRPIWDDFWRFRDHYNRMRPMGASPDQIRRLYYGDNTFPPIEGPNGEQY